MQKNFFSGLGLSATKMSRVLEMDENAMEQLLSGSLSLEDDSDGLKPIQSPTAYVLIPVEGLHLMCDFVIHRSALFGNEPNHVPSRVGLHDYFAHPYHYLSRLSFQDYLRPALIGACQMDAETKQELRLTPGKRLKDCTCLMFDLEDYSLDLSLPETPEGNSALLERVLFQANQILDALWLGLYQPCENHSLGRAGSLGIGRAGSLGNGVSGIWVSRGENTRLIARRTSSYGLVREPVDVSLDDVRRVYSNRVFQELRYAAHEPIATMDPTLQRIFLALKDVRDSRELQCWDARLRHLFIIAESLAVTTSGPPLQGHALRQAIADVAASSWYNGLVIQDDDTNVLSVVNELWDIVQNRTVHKFTAHADFHDDPRHYIVALEYLVISMIRSLVTGWTMQCIEAEAS